MAPGSLQLVVDTNTFIQLRDVNNLGNWFTGGTRDRELSETRQAWEETERLRRSSRLGHTELSDLAVEIVREAMRRADRLPSTPILVEFCVAAEETLRRETIGAIEPVWRAIDGDVVVAMEFRQILAKRRRWAADFDRIFGIVRTQLVTAFLGLLDVLPDACFDEEASSSFEVPLIELLPDPAGVIEQLMFFPYTDETMSLGLFEGLRETLARNIAVASGLPPTTNLVGQEHRAVLPHAQRGKSPAELVELYLSGTHFARILTFPVPFGIPAAVRFEHTHIVGGTGHGKTQLMQRMIHGDLVAACRDRRSVVVIDSQGDLINKLVRLDLFSPEHPDSLADRLVLIDPADVEFPPALNLFDAPLDRLTEYRPVDQERVLNGVVELYETFFGDLLGAELTQKQGVIFRYLARLMLTIPGATIYTLMQLMEDGRPFKGYMGKLEGSARHFFGTEFFEPSFTATKKQILRRLWGVLSTPAFERMFAQANNKLDLYGALNEGKIVLVSTAKDLLKSEGSALFGRFMIALLAQAAQERSILAPEDRTPTFVFIDEAQEYFDENVETLLNQARKYRLGITLAHQTLDQLSPRLRSVILSNTSVKCVGGVSARDAGTLAPELHTSSDFIESMRRRGGQTEFAAWLKHLTPNAIRLAVPLGFLEMQPLSTEEAFAQLLAENRARYCGTIAEANAALQRAHDRSADENEVPEPHADADQERSPSPRRKPERLEPPIAPIRATTASGPTRDPLELGKGGSQHRYVQHLIKGLAEERGFRVVIEEPTGDGQIDVALHRQDLTVACEISVTSSAEHEAQNLAKCIRAGFVQVWAIAPDAKRKKAIRSAAERRLSGEDFEKVQFATTEDIIALLDGLPAIETEGPVVRGYRVKVSRTVVTPSDAKERRTTIARVLARSLKDMKDGE